MSSVIGHAIQRRASERAAVTLRSFDGSTEAESFRGVSSQQQAVARARELELI